MSLGANNHVNRGREFVQLVANEDLSDYLTLNGWRQVESPRSTWSVFSGPVDYYGDPIEIVLSNLEDSKASLQYKLSALELLAALQEEPLETIALRVTGVNRDILNVRNTHQGSSQSISIHLAAKQISKLQSLIKQASNSERNAKPFYSNNYQSQLGKTMTGEFRFGHTQNRSFGLTIKSPELSPKRYRQRTFSLNDDSFREIEPDIPIGRRIVERIVRGLIVTKAATRENSVSPLLTSYTSGFSANMCDAILGISRNFEPTVEYSVLWSPRIDPSEDIAHVEPITLNGTDYKYLKTAATELRELEPETETTIRGLVEGLSSPDDPRKLGVGQSVIVRWTRQEDDRVLKVYMDLVSPHDYQLAIQAHEKWQPVEVTGILKLVGTRWRLLTPKSFRLA
jgi:hypothetical protein